jgi:ribonuclease BN (tRNA processing enzyme)
MATGVTVQVLGSGDAFGSGGRLQTCIHVSSAATRFLIDCGATSLTALKRAHIDPAGIDAVLISHLHGDHFGGLPFFILDARFSKRERPLAIAGPAGVAKRIGDAMELMFPGSSAIGTRFEVSYSELRDRQETLIGSLRVVPYTVIHPSGAPAHALRIETDGVVVAYSGDTEWTDALLDAARDSDLFICEAYRFDQKVRFHLDYASIRDRLEAITSRRVVLTHLGEDMLQRLEEVALECAEDGRVFHLSPRSRKTPAAD